MGMEDEVVGNETFDSKEEENREWDWYKSISDKHLTVVTSFFQHWGMSAQINP